MSGLVFDGLKPGDIATMALDDFHAARESRRDVEERKLDAYRLYRLFRKELREGGRGDADGPFGWSRLSSPIVFYICETILPRIAITPPQVIVKARNPYAMRHQQAKELRINHQLRQSRYEEEMLLALKQFLILGDGPVKTPWDRQIGGPRMVSIDWFDWFLSPDAARWYDAEVMYHRTWHTKRSLAALAHRDKNRIDPYSGEKLPPLYDHKALERIAYGSAYREADDASYAARREAAGLGTTSWPDQDGPVALVECHYSDGSFCVIAGDESPIMVRCEREPLFTDPRGNPFRPFSVFQNTPDLFQPYGIGDAEMVADHQHESSTIKNQAIDQGTGNIMAPKAYNQNKISADAIQAAWSSPNGLLPVDGNPADVIQSYSPGQLSGDVERILEHNRREAQEIAGISDIVQGIAAAQMQTATEISALREEANQRFRLKIKLTEFGARRVAINFDFLDRMHSTRSITVETEKGFQLAREGRGVTQITGTNFARVDTSANAPGMEYELELDAGSMAAPNMAEQAQRVRALISDLAAMPPQVQMMIRWPELLRMLIESTGNDADRVIDVTGGMAGAMPASPDGPPVPGEVPVGAPVPLEEGANGRPATNGAAAPVPA